MMFYALPYICFFSLLLFSSLINPRVYYRYSFFRCDQNKAIYMLQYFLIISLYVFFLSFRGNVYYDWKSYRDLYNTVPKFGSQLYHNYTPLEWEIGFYIFASLCKFFSSDYIFFQFVNSIVDIIILVMIFKRYYKNQLFCLALTFFYCFNGFTIEVNLLRNSKAILCFLLSLKYLNNEKYLKYFILNTIGVLFHTSAIIYLITGFFIKKIQFNKITLVILFFIANCVFLCQINLVSKILDFIRLILPPSFKKVIILLDRYKNVGAYGITIGYLERLLTFWVLFIYSKTIRKWNYGQIFLNSYYIYYFNYLVFAPLGTICERIGVLFSYSCWFLYPFVFKNLKKKDSKFFFILIFWIYGILKLISVNHNVDYQYSNILFEY